MTSHSRPALTEEQVEALISALELAQHYVEYAINCTPIGSRAEELLDEARDRIHEALAAARPPRATAGETNV